MDPATSTTRSPVVPHNLKLSAQQEELLYAALNSNNKPSTTTNSNTQSTHQFTMAPSAVTDSPVQAPGSGTLNGFEESPFIDYEYDFDPEGSFDYGSFANDSQGQMIGNLPGASSDGDADIHDKRSHPDDDEDDDEGGGKRRESDGKTSKKPGRKPLTSEPTSKRKAQNRAAQRAFRERKEKHLKDLETKVDDLEKASESANHENSILRSQMEKMSAELQEYKKRFAATNGLGRSTSLNHSAPSYLSGKGLGNGGANNPSDVNFSFEFPRFGRLPGPPQTNSSALSSPSDYTSPTIGQQQNPSPRNQSLQSPGGSITGNGLTQTPTQMGGDMSSLSGLFSPSLLESVSKSPQYDFFGGNSNTNGSRSSSDSISNNNTSYNSPSASSNGHQGTSSSCGTSPEPTTQSPHYNKGAEVTLTTIGEEKTGEGELTFCDKLNMACGNPNQPIPRTMSKSEPENTHTLQSLQNQTFDFNGIDWFAQQNGNQFDPQLFGDYREPQENVLSNDGITDSFFSDAFAIPDFQSPFNIAPSPVPKKDLLSQIDQQNEDEEVVPAEDRSTLLNCNTIWDRLQACPKVKDGEFDLDLLCKDLQKKAKCSETGAVVNESDFNSVLQTYVNGKGKKA